MRYVYWVIDNILAGRAGPTRYAWDPAELYAGGIRNVVSLAAEVPVGNLEKHGFHHYKANLPPVLLFSMGMRKAFIHQALPAWDFIHEQVEAGTPTLVHCHAGKDRTGVVLAGYLVIYRNVAVEEAIQTLRAANPEAMSAPGYEPALRLLKPGEKPDPRTLL